MFRMGFELALNVSCLGGLGLVVVLNPRFYAICTVRFKISVTHKKGTGTSKMPYQPETTGESTSNRIIQDSKVQTMLLPSCRRVEEPL
ncbi:hypothetical protein E2562_038624 [Oryza meyeriana var. granulata]|uniref:Uncharacterized protein n=1 Tax=Oryza meyeriana var. granulata TaxID=110450 RepID=A0A6G1E8L5_9ORYZ|nr:hypothetical protein E2562_038624 [Oryza meyeriana var. granulata]